MARRKNNMYMYAQTLGLFDDVDVDTNIDKNRNNEHKPNVHKHNGHTPSWYTDDIRDTTMALCRSGEIPRTALTSTVGRARCDDIISDKNKRHILDELYGELCKCLAELQSASHGFSMMDPGRYTTHMLRFLSDQDRRREALRDGILRHLADDPCWAKKDDGKDNMVVILDPVQIQGQK